MALLFTLGPNLEPVIYIYIYIYQEEEFFHTLCDVPYEAKRNGGFSAFSCLYFVNRLVYLWSTGIEGRVLGMGDFPHQTTFTPFHITLFMGDSPRQIFNLSIISRFEVINIQIAIEYYSMHTYPFSIDFVTNIARALLKLWCVLSTFT